jgi:hypothetical protein
MEVPREVSFLCYLPFVSKKCKDDWESKVLHRGYHTDEYVLWFIYYYTATEIMAAFTNNLKHHGDDILDELQKDGIVKIK